MPQTGLYVHVPFCRQLCPYCDFAVAVRADPPHEAYCDALLRELDARQDELGEVRTIYFGGGTPAMWSVAALRRFVTGLGQISPLETTIEANPLDITAERLDAWADVGIDRISLGVQSFDAVALSALGRDHDSGRARDAVMLVVAHPRGFRTSLDLIYAGPEYGPNVAATDAAVAGDLGVDHVSAYELTVETGTVFGRREREGTLGLAPADRREDWGFEMVEALAGSGFERYEVSSFGRSGDRALHNSSYWLGLDYVGLGTGAHSFRQLEAGQAIRRANPRRLSAYMGDAAAEVEVVGAMDHLAERLFLAARTTIGVRWDDLQDRFAGDHSQKWDRVRDAASEMVVLGWLAADADLLRATPQGLDFADDVAQRFWVATHSG